MIPSKRNKKIFKFIKVMDMMINFYENIPEDTQ